MFWHFASGTILLSLSGRVEGQHSVLYICLYCVRVETRLPGSFGAKPYYFQTSAKGKCMSIRSQKSGAGHLDSSLSDLDGLQSFRSP